MAVMHKLRENMTGILFFLLIMFVLSMTIGGLVGGANILDLLKGRKSDTILFINDQQISYDQFNRARQNQFEEFRKKNGQDPTGYQLQQLEDQIWESMIIEILKQQLIEKLDLRVTKDEVKYFILQNPHPILRMEQSFWNENKQFDINKYQAALASPEYDYFWRYIEQQLTLFLPFEKLENEIKATIRFTDNELREEYKKKNVKVKAEYLIFEPAKYIISDDEIKDSEIQSYYKKHQKEYKINERRKIRYILFSTSPTKNDSLQIQQQITELLQEIKDGADFADLAEIYSDDPGSAEKGGDLGYFGKGTMVKPFEEAAFGAKAGDIVGPIETVHGLHIIKVEDRRKENDKDEVKARHILLKYKASRETLDSARDNADYFSENAQEDGFEELARTESLKIDSTNYFENTGFIPGLGMQKTIVMKAFHEEIGKPSRVFHIDDKGYVVFEVAEIQPEKIQSIGEVKSRIISKLKLEKQMELAKRVANEIRSKIQEPDDFKNVAAADSLEIKTTDWITFDGYVSGLGRDAKFNSAALELKTDEISAPVSGTRGCYLIKVIDRQDYVEEDFLAAKQSLKAELAQQKLRLVYTDWIANLKEQADIKDYRYMFY